MVTKKSLAEVVHRARYAKGWTQADCSAKSGLTIRTISRIESGAHDKITGLTAAKLGQALGVNLKRYESGLCTSRSTARSGAGGPAGADCWTDGPEG